MPKARKKGREHRASALVLCKCRSRCLKYNEATGRHEGDGILVSADTRVKHRRDERILALLQLNPHREEVQELQEQPMDHLARENGWIALIQAQRDFLQELPVVSHLRGLKFANNPIQHGRYRYDFDPDGPEPLDIPPPNVGVHSLDNSAIENRSYIDRENTIWELYRIVKSFQQTEGAKELGAVLYEDLVTLEREKEMQWESLRCNSSSNPHFNTAIFFRKRNQKNPQLEAASLVSLILQYHYFLPRRGCEIYLAGISDIYANNLISGQLQGPSKPRFPVDPRPLPRLFNLDPITSTYVSCITCHCLYSYDPVRPTVPDKCTFKQTRESDPCNADLWKIVDRGPFGKIRTPVRKYVHQGLKGWLGRALSQPGMGEEMYRYPRELMASENREEVVDIWQGQVFRNLRVSGLPDPFFPGPSGELRLAFGMSVDGFAPFQNKTAKQTASSTGIWLVLLNLPWHLRYLPQNIYLAGVIPGPNKPSNDQINHYVQLVVNDLQDLYRPGIFFTRTYDCEQGRLCRGLLVPLVCDLLTAHQVIGYPGAPTAHYFCTCCELDIHDINIVDRREWPKKSIHHIRRYASIYRNASSERHQQATFDACGWRWSPLFELDYWDPSLFTAIDSMHSLDLNVLKHHVRDLFQIDLKNDGGLALRPPSAERVKRIVSVKADLAMLRNCQDAIYENRPQLMYELLGFQRKVLFSFCLDYDIRSPGQSLVTGTRWILARCIYQWRQGGELPGLVAFQARYPLLSEAQEKLIQDQKDEEGDESAVEGPDDQAPSSRPQADPENAVPSVPKRSILRRLTLQLLELVHDGDATPSKVYDKITVNLLAHFCDLLLLDRTQLEVDKSKTLKQRLFQFLLTSLQGSIELQETLKEMFAEESPTAPSSSAFLGKDVMEAIWSDMARTRLPSWITPVPRDWGTSHRGKLSADNWRIICCVHLPITLIRLFGQSTDRRRALLDNFMTLVSAVRISTRSKSSPSHVNAYNNLMFSYSKGTLDLFPDYGILPSHHAALHIGDMLQRFGPKHSHDSPYYERYILFFHRMNTNHKLGEVEGTLLRTAVRSANLIGLLRESQDARELLKYTVGRLRTHSIDQLRGFRLAEASDPWKVLEHVDGDPDHRLPDATPMPARDHELLCELLQSAPDERNTPVSPRAMYLDTVSHQQAVYAIWESTRYRDSAVLFQDSTERCAGVIQTIFLHQHTLSSGEVSVGHYLIISRYNSVDEDVDPFRKYGDAGGFSCERELGLPTLVALESVISHAAITDLEELGMVHVLPISRSYYRDDWSSHTTSPRHIASRSVRMELPHAAHKRIAENLGDSFPHLKAMATMSRVLMETTCPILFRTIRVTSIPRLRELESLLDSPTCTIPRTAGTLIIYLSPPVSEPFSNLQDGLAISYSLLRHFTSVQENISINLPYIISRSLDWGILKGHSQLRRFVLTGVHGSLRETITTVSYMRSLECLILDASWKNDRLPKFWKGGLTNTPLTMPPNLKEICFSACSLELVQWMYFTEIGTMDLHVVRMKVDGRLTTLASLNWMSRFMTKFGKRVAHLFIWLEEVDPDDVCIEIRNCISQSTFQLELFFPAIPEGAEVEYVTDEVICREDRPEVLHAVHGHDIEDETAFWDLPVRCPEDDCVVRP